MTRILVTDSTASGSDWVPALEDMIRKTVHETRNALNGIVVNLEVVRTRLSRTTGGSPMTQQDVLSFAEQAIEQAELAVRLNEGIRSLLYMIAACVSSDGKMRCATAGNARTISFDVDSVTSERLFPGLKALGAAAGFTAERRNGSVIFTVPEKSSTGSAKYE
jgi:hypothetical protein